LIPGVNKLGPLGSKPFSVGDGGVALEGVVVVVVVVVDVEGACSPLLPQPAVSAPIAIRAPPPRTANKRRVNKFEFIVWSCSFKASDPPPKGGFWAGQPTLGRRLDGKQAMSLCSKVIHSYIPAH
jgi:hypothetical protein